MRVLIVLAHPHPKSFTAKIAKTYKEGAESAGHKIELLDLYKTKLQLGFLKPETKKEYETSQPVRQKLQEKLAWADEIVFIHPLWWGGPPAILKNFLDQTLTPGFAYRHAKEKKFLSKRLNIMPERLLKGRRARLLITCDGQAWTNTLRLMPWLGVWYFYVFRFTGLKMSSFHLFDYMRFRGDLTRSRWLAKVRTLGAHKR
jgi:putative NADPH-quinone reductase